MPGFRRLNRMQKMVLGLVSLVALLFGAGFWYLNSRSTPSEGVACTQEAKLCPDGVTYVGRQGPNCEFAACPASTTTSSGGSASSHAIVVLDAHLSQTVNALGASIKPLSVVEDSRCPTDVQCIQAGRVVLKAQITTANGTTIQNFILNTPLVVDNQKMILVSATPDKISTVTINPTDYVFTFNVYAHQN